MIEHFRDHDASAVLQSILMTGAQSVVQRTEKAKSILFELD